MRMLLSSYLKFFCLFSFYFVSMFLMFRRSWYDLLDAESVVYIDF